MRQHYFGLSYDLMINMPDVQRRVSKAINFCLSLVYYIIKNTRNSSVTWVTDDIVDQGIPVEKEILFLFYSRCTVKDCRDLGWPGLS
jgi:hypothetical protein